MTDATPGSLGAHLRADAPLTLSVDDLTKLQSINDPISLDEIVAIYLPLSRLLSLYVAATQGLFKATQRFLIAEAEVKVPLPFSQPPPQAIPLKSGAQQ